MKKQILTVAVAALALAGCSKSETVEVAGNRAIGFNSFVNKNTRAVITIDALSTDFYVFGRYGTTPNWGIAFDNEISTAVYYWKANETYHFGAYANGSNGKINDATFDAGTQTLTFPEYTPDDTKDLVAAVARNIAANDQDNLSSMAPVELNFKHLLSQVKLTFTTDAAATYKMTITNVKIEGAVSTANGKYNGTATWTAIPESGNNGYTYEDFGTTAEGGKVISSGVPADQVKFVIPQESTDNLKVTFIATLKGTEAGGTATFEATLEHALSTANTWMAQYCYNYTAKVPLEKVIENPEGKVKITFKPTLEAWKPFEDITTTPGTTEP